MWAQVGRESSSGRCSHHLLYFGGIMNSFLKIKKGRLCATHAVMMIICLLESMLQNKGLKYL